MTIQPERIAKPSPVRMLLVLMAVVFAIELSVMIVFDLFITLPLWLENILDASTLVALLFPTLYYSVYRPLTKLIERHVTLEMELIEHRDHLEEMVALRTEQVNEFLRLHGEEDELAAYVMGSYLNASQGDERVNYSILSASNLFSGDVISVSKTPDGGLNVMMLDAMGHGLSAAINALPAIQAFYSMSKKGMTLAELVPEINDKVRELSPPGRFLAATFLNIDSSSTHLTGWIGGTPKVYLYSEGTTQSFSSSNLSLGVVYSSKHPFEYFNAPWSKQSLLVTCTDGVLEGQGADGIELGDQWVFEVVKKYGNTLDKNLFDTLWKNALAGNKPHDDASILIINQKVNG